MVGGIIILGDTDTDVLVRAIGPALTAFGVSGALEDPTLELHDKDGATIASNDDWKETQQSAIEATGLAPSDDRESAILMTLAPDSYTAIVRGKNDTTGVALVEVYKHHAIASVCECKRVGDAAGPIKDSVAQCSAPVRLLAESICHRPPRRRILDRLAKSNSRLFATDHRPRCRTNREIVFRSLRAPGRFSLLSAGG